MILAGQLVFFGALLVLVLGWSLYFAAVEIRDARGSWGWAAVFVVGGVGVAGLLFAEIGFLLR